MKKFYKVRAMQLKGAVKDGIAIDIVSVPEDASPKSSGALNATV